MSILAWLDLDREVLGFDRQSLFNFELIKLVIDELETLQDHAQHQSSFLHGKGAPDTGALPIAKGFVGIGWERLFSFGVEALGLEFLDILAPHALIPVQHRG